MFEIVRNFFNQKKIPTAFFERWKIIKYHEQKTINRKRLSMRYIRVHLYSEHDTRTMSVVVRNPTKKLM